MFLHKEHHTSYCRFLLVIGLTKCGAVAMNVQAASACVVRRIAHIYSLREDSLPRKVVQMIGQRCRLGNDLKALAKRSVVLAVNMLVLRIADVENCARVVVILTASVNFKLNAHKQIALTVEDWRGLVAVIFD